VATSTVSAVLFAKDLRKVARFYREVMGASLHRSDAYHEALDCLGFRLVVHQIPQEFAQSIEISTPPERRENAALRLDFPVDHIELARRLAKELGGQIDELAPPWAAETQSFFLGYDPEGNVVGVMPNKAHARAGGA
jgi:predicted enzyme related to lactoylglutathione lyase